MKQSQIKKKRGGPPITRHMLQFGDRYNPRTKILTTEKGERLQKYAHGYFQINKLNKKLVTPPVKKLLESYPKWIIFQKEIKAQVFQNCFRLMIEAHPKQLLIFQQQSQIKSSLLREIDHIRFPYLKQLTVHFQLGTNLESMQWIEAPLLQQIMVFSKTILSSLKPLAKTNFPNLKIVKLSAEDGKISGTRNYDLQKISRIRMKNTNRNNQKLMMILKDH